MKDEKVMKRAQGIDQGLVLTVMTIFSTFLMGFIDAYTFIVLDGVFASPQTGNIIALVGRLAGGDWMQAVIHAFVFFGFLIGAFLGQMMIDRIGDYGRRTYRIYLFYQVIYLFLVALTQQVLSQSMIGFFLGLLAGYVLTIFRKIRKTGINNGIMTGNAKSMMNNLYSAVVHKNKTARGDFYVLLSGILIFMVGVGAGTFILEAGAAFNLWGAFLLSAVAYLWLLFKR